MLNERIDPNSIVGSGRVTRYLFAALSTSFIGAGLVRFAYTPLLPVLIESRWFDTSATVYLSAANPAGALFGAVTSTWLARRCSKVFILRGMNVLATLSLLACALPISLEWYFSWRFLSGVATGATIVLVAATFLPHVPADRKGVASGLIFVGLGLGVALYLNRRLRSQGIHDFKCSKLLHLNRRLLHLIRGLEAYPLASIRGQNCI